MELSCTLLYCFANEVDKFIKSFEWFKNDVANYYITNKHNHEYHKAVWTCRNICYSYASHLEYFEIVKYLTNSSYGTNITMVQIDPIIICCIKNNIESVEKYINLRNLDATKENKYYELNMYIHVACYCNNIDLMKYLISNYVDENCENKYKLACVYTSCLTFISDDENELDPYYINDSIIAALNNNFNMVKVLFELYYNENDVFSRHFDYTSQNIATYLCEVLLYAARYNNIEMVKYIFNLVETNKYVTRRTYIINFNRCVIEAITNNHGKLLRFLLTKYTLYDLMDILRNHKINLNVRMFNIIIKTMNVSINQLYRIYMWCAQFKSAERTFDLSQPSLVGTMTNRKCGLSPTHMFQQYSKNHMIKYFISLGIKPHALRVRMELI